MGCTQRIQWTEEKVKEKVLEAINKLQLDRMPSREELDQYYHNSALSCRISKTGGFYSLAQSLGYQVKRSHTSIGTVFENLISDILVKKGYSVEKMTVRHPYDLLVNGSVKIDVKSSYLCKYNGSIYTFSLRKKHPTCDLFIAVTLRDDGSINKIYIIPSIKLTGKTQLTIGEKTSAYNVYINCWHYIDHYNQFVGGL
jgi:hypothetical protein